MIETKISLTRTPSAQPERDLVGRGRRDGNRLFKEWYTELDAAAESGAPSAYVFVMGSTAEVLKAFDLNLVFPYLNKAEDYGYSTDVCGYVKADVGMHLDGRKHPNGRIPKPSIVVATNMCNTYVKWVEIWQRMYGCKVFVLDIPGQRGIGWSTEPGSEQFENDRRYVQSQLEELIEACVAVTGRPFK